MYGGSGIVLFERVSAFICIPQIFGSELVPHEPSKNQESNN